MNTTLLRGVSERAVVRWLIMEFGDHFEKPWPTRIVEPLYGDDRYDMVDTTIREAIGWRTWDVTVRVTERRVYVKIENYFEKLATMPQNVAWWCAGRN